MNKRNKMKKTKSFERTPGRFQVHTLLQEQRQRVSPPPPLEELKLRHGQFWRHFWDVSQRVCTVEFASCLSINTWCRCFALGDGHDVPNAQLSWLVDAFNEGLVCFHSAQVQKNQPWSKKDFCIPCENTQSAGKFLARKTHPVCRGKKKCFCNTVLRQKFEIYKVKIWHYSVRVIIRAKKKLFFPKAFEKTPS